MARIDEYLKKIAGEQVTPPAPVSSLDRELSDIPEITPGGGIPDITEADVGKVLTAAEDGDGGYAPTWANGGGIPDITESDVGKVLTAAEDGEGGYIPTWAEGGGGVEPLFVLIAEGEYGGSPSVVGWTTQNYATKAAEVASAILAGTPVYIKAGAYDSTTGDIPDEAITLLAPVVAVVPYGGSEFSIRSALHAYQDPGVIVIMGYSITLGGLGISVEKINYELEIATPGD